MSNMNATKKGFFNILYGILSQVVLIAFAVVTPILVIENYGSETNGLLHSAEQIFVYLSLFEAGVGYATLQALYRPVAENDTQSINAIMAATKIYYTRTGIFYTLCVVLFAFLYPVLVSTNLPFFLVVGVVLFGGLGGCLHYFYQGKYVLLMQAEGYSYVTTRINMLINVLINSTKIILLLSGCDVLAVQISFFLFQGVRTLCFHAYVSKKYPDIDFSVTPDFKAIAQKKAVFVHQVATLIFNSTDVLLLTFLTQDLKIVSVYTIYNYIVTALLNLVQTMSGGFDFKLGQMYAVDREQYHRLYHVFEIFHQVLIFSVMSALYVIFLPFMALYTRNVSDISYINTWYPLLFILVPLLTHGRAAANSGITFAGHFEQTKWYAVIESAINLSVSIAAILLIGLPGALLGTIAASVYRTINQIWYYYKYISPDSAWRTIRRWIVCGSVFALVVLVNSRFPLTLNGYVPVAFAAAVSGILFLGIYGGLQMLVNPQERVMIIRILSGPFAGVRRRLHGKN